MARKLVTLVFCTMVLALAVEAYQGRKMQQLSNQVGSRATAAQADTAAKINAAIDNNAKVRPGTPAPKATTASAHTPKPTPGTVTGTIAATSKSTQGGAGSAGTSTAGQAATAAMINSAASGTKVTKPPAQQPGKVTTAIASAPKTSQGVGSSGGTSTAGQAATAAMINQAAGGAKPRRP